MLQLTPLGAVGRGFQPVENLSDAGTSHPQKPGQRSPAFKLAGVEQRLVIPGESERITGRLTGVDSLFPYRTGRYPTGVILAHGDTDVRLQFLAQSVLTASAKRSEARRKVQ